MPKSIHSNEYKEVLARLKKARLSAGLTQVQVCEKLKKPQSYLSKIEAGERRIDILEIKRIAQIYRKSVSYFLWSIRNSSIERILIVRKNIQQIKLSKEYLQVTVSLEDTSLEFTEDFSVDGVARGARRAREGAVNPDAPACSTSSILQNGDLPLGLSNFTFRLPRNSWFVPIKHGIQFASGQRNSTGFVN